MRFTESTPAVLLLQDGTIFHGKALGKIGTHGGEICFNTGMTGYQEIYTDPSYAGQVIINTTCLLYTSPSPRDYAASRMPSSA